MDEDLKTYLAGMEQRLEEKIRTEITGVRAEIVGVRSEIEALETRLLSEFWKWGRVADQADSAYGA